MNMKKGLKVIVCKKRVPTQNGKKVQKSNGGWKYEYPTFGVQREINKDFLKMMNNRKDKG